MSNEQKCYTVDIKALVLMRSNIDHKVPNHPCGQGEDTERADEDCFVGRYKDRLRGVGGSGGKEVSQVHPGHSGSCKCRSNLKQDKYINLIFLKPFYNFCTHQK